MITQDVSRQQRRAMRLQRFVVSDREAYRAAMRTGLDYRVSGETGALVVHSHSLSYHRAKTPNITIPPAGRGWDKSGRARVVQEAQEGAATPDNQGQNRSTGSSNKNR